MNLFLVKREHHDGQTIYGVCESRVKAVEIIKELCNNHSRIKEFEYEIVEIKLNELVYIDS